jgi:hypothetical protein
VINWRAEQQIHPYPLYLAAPRHRPAWLRVDRLLGEHGIQQDTAASRQIFESLVERRKLEETDPEELQQLRDGWCVGSAAFKEEMLSLMKDQLSENHPGQLRSESAEAKGRRIIAEELSKLGWSSADPAMKRKCSPEKIEIAGRLRRETTLTMKNIAQLLEMGSPRNVAVRLYERKKGHAAGPPEAGI